MEQPETFGDIQEGDVFEADVETEVWPDGSRPIGDGEEMYVAEVRVDEIHPRLNALIDVKFTLFGEQGQQDRLSTVTSVFGKDTQLHEGWKRLIHRE